MAWNVASRIIALDLDGQDIYNERYSEARKALPEVVIENDVVCHSERHRKGKGGARTLLFGLRQKTISECTFLVLRRFSILSLTALKAAAMRCSLDTIWFTH